MREALAEQEIIPFIGVYDAFSATISARYFDGIFLSGFSFAASFYGLPDIGLISWSDIAAYVQRVRTVLPQQHILVDMDDGYADIEVACHVTSLMESVGASGIILEDQKRPKRCGHLDNKQLLSLDEYLPKLERVLKTRKDMVVVARTDASDLDDILRRTKAFAEAGADWLLVDGISSPEIIKSIRSFTDKPLVFNYIAGGKSKSRSLPEMKAQGISAVLYSTPCLFSAQAAIQESMQALKAGNGYVQVDNTKCVNLAACQGLLEENFGKRTILGDFK
jgi:2-methylisocitrate lyase-like PEP mutase family enzyme